MKNTKYLLMLALMISTITTSLSTEEHGNSDIYDSYNGLEDFGVEDAWNMGYTGKGVKIALIDTGIDFATPDLLGTQARISNSSSPYDGWPMVIDLNSLSSYQQGMTGSWYANTTSTDVEGYKVTGTSKSGIYHIGDHPDQHLANLYGQPVKVLVVDEKISGAYDTVYVDLNNNVDFRDDKPCRRGDEISYWDRDNDGYPDESGGMIYFIADGNTPLPLARMLYGEETKIPKNGELVAFYIDSWLHGTTCTSVIVGQGKNVKGIAPDAKIIPVRIFGQNDRILRLLASLGYDGVSNTGDEANIISGSIVNARLNTGVDEDSAFLEYLTTKVSPNTTMLYPIGNDGSGYGTCSAPSSEHVINVGAIYDHWWNGSSYKGDVTCFSSRGPNMLGQVKPNVLATSYSIPQSLPLWNTHNGKTAWEVRGRGTCATTPHVATVIALIYQAYRDTYGEYPTSEKARDILMSSATDIDEEIFAQGAGIINAKRAVEIASGKDGILIEPALLSTTPVAVGSNLKFNLSISNYSEDSMNLTPLKLIIDKTKYVTLNPENESTFLPIPTDMLDCDLIKVSSYYPRTARNKMINEEYGYDLHLYNWKDVNGDGKAQESELEVLSGSFGDFGEGITSEVRMHHPAERMNDGILIILKKRGDTTIKDLRVVIETYKWTPWDIEINVNGDYVQLSIPTPNTTGVYQGKILLEYSDDKHCIPASFSTYVSDEIKVNNTKEIYENEKIHGRFEGDGYKWETKVYPIYHQGHDLAIISVGWDDPDTDIDVYIYNEDILNTSKLWKYPAKPPIELPKLKVLKESGHSIRNLGSIIHYRDDDYASVLSGPTSFYTSTEENKEEITGVLKDGLNFVILHQVFSGGNMYGENITIDVDITPLINISLNAKSG
ncbi:MAG: S8 family serine peptidase, partial [Paludibacter sp.]|nr:S8 family serine peptidase [Paludibacter sp.]